MIIELKVISVDKEKSDMLNAIQEKISDKEYDIQIAKEE